MTVARRLAVRYNVRMARRTLPTKSVAFRLPQDVCDQLDAFVESDPTLTKTETVAVALYAFMGAVPPTRTSHIASYRMRLYGGPKK